MENNKHILITAGGGGHFAPALAVIKLLSKKQGVSLHYVGRKYSLEGDKAISLEYKTVALLGIPQTTITAGRLQRSVSLRSLRSLLRIPGGLLQALDIINKEKPDIVLSFGGYVALPVTIAAWLNRIPVVIHEQTRGAGLANRVAGKFATKICLTYDSSKRFFPKGKTVLTGNPLRESLVHPHKSSITFPDKLPIIFVTGGSLGAHAINVLMEAVLPELLKRYQIIHQTGDAQEYQDYARLVKFRDGLSESLQKRYVVTKFIDPDEVGSVLQEASLVIGRAGISTIAELLYFSKPAILIPLPHGQRNEQTDNAKYVASLGLARVLQQADADAETMYTTIVEVMNDLPSFVLNNAAQNEKNKQAAEAIVSIVLSNTKKLRKETQKEA